MNWKLSESICVSVVTFCGAALYFFPASAAVVGQGVYVSNTTMACPSIAALERYDETTRDNPDEATKEALALLSAAGFSKDNPLRFTVDLQNQQAQQAAMQLIQAQWKWPGRKWAQKCHGATIAVQNASTPVAE